MVSDTTDPVAAFNEFIREYRDEDGNYIYREQIQQMTVEGEISLKVDFTDVIKFNPELARRSIDEPKEFLEAGNRAVTEVVEIEDSDYAFTTREFFIRFFNMADSEKLSLCDIRAEHINKLLLIEGEVTKLSNINPLLIEGYFKCPFCNEIIIKTQYDGQYNPPVQCLNPGCSRKGNFELQADESRFIDYQIIGIKNIDNKKESTNRKLEVLLTNDLVNSIIKGDYVNIIGILNPFPKIQKWADGKLASFNLQINANNIIKKQKTR